jgi:ABC-type transport system involved in multi-copper enzyme maturation permease subunit
MLSTILLVFSFVLFVLAAFGVPNPPQRWNLVAAGLAFWVLSILLGGIHLGISR